MSVAVKFELIQPMSDETSPAWPDVGDRAHLSHPEMIKNSRVTTTGEAAPFRFLVPIGSREQFSDQAWIINYCRSVPPHCRSK
jgi:hypothetical protein